MSYATDRNVYVLFTEENGYVTYGVDFGQSDEGITHYANNEIQEESFTYYTEYKYPDLTLSAKEPSKIGLSITLASDSDYKINVLSSGNTATISYTYEALTSEQLNKVYEWVPHTFYNPETGKEEQFTQLERTGEKLDSSYGTVTQTLTITDFSAEKFQNISIKGYTFTSWQEFADYVATQDYQKPTEGNDNLIGSHDDNTINAKGGDDTVTTKEGNDTVNGGAGNDTIYTGAGDDKLDGGTGADKLYGGSGNDTYYIDNTADQVIEYANEGTDTVYSSVSHTLAANVENLVLTGSANIYGAGNNSDNTLNGNEGNNRLNSGRGNDTVYGNGGNDTLNGGEGNDYLDGGDGNDTVNGEAGNDTLIGGKGSDTLNGGAGDDTYIYTKGDGDDTIIDASGADTLQLKGLNSLADVSVHSVKTAQGTDWEISIIGTDDVITIKNQIESKGAYAVEKFVFGNTEINAKKLALYASDEVITATINGTSRADTLNGTIGNDTIDGKGGADKMSGGRGDDTYIVDNSGDTVTELADQGRDTVISSVSHTLATNVEDLVLTGSANIYGAGNNSDNTLKGNDGNNRLNSGRGNDTVYGGAGDDTINGGSGNDQLYGQSGNDLINGEEGNDTLAGGAGNDTYLFGMGYGTDNIIDNEGSNTVKFNNGVALKDLHIEAVTNSDGGKDWVISIPSSKDALTIANQQAADGSHAVETFVIGSSRYTTDDLVKVFGLAAEKTAFAQNITVSVGFHKLDTSVHYDFADYMDYEHYYAFSKDSFHVGDNIQSVTIANTSLPLYLNGEKFNGGKLTVAQLSQLTYETGYVDTYRISTDSDLAGGRPSSFNISDLKNHAAQSFSYQLTDSEGNSSDVYTFTLGNAYWAAQNNSFTGTQSNDYIDMTDLSAADLDGKAVQVQPGDASVSGDLTANPVINKTVNLQGGNDTFIDRTGNDTVHAGDGDDTVYAAGKVYGDNGNDVLIGQSSMAFSYDNYNGFTAINQQTTTTELYGGDGDDKLGGYATLMNGGNGNDTLEISGMSIITDPDIDIVNGQYYPSRVLKEDLNTIGTQAEGGSGNDLYIVHKAPVPFYQDLDVTHQISDESGNDTVRFSDGLSIKQLHTSVDTDGSWTISYGYDDHTTGWHSYNMAVKISGQSAEAQPVIETFTFDDGTSYTAAQFLAQTQKAQAGAALSLDLGSDSVSETSSALAADTVATVNNAKLAALTAADSASSDNALLDSSSADAHALDSSLSALTGNTASDTAALAAVNSSVDSLNYAALGNIVIDDAQANNAAV